jgi:outer membrane protein OmpA-like peptidoglycan-associated protein
MKKSVLLSMLGLMAIGLGGCGSAMPTKELRDARSAYQEASHSKAAELTPDKLLSAKQALDRAEIAFEDDPGSYHERSLAYIAQRMSELSVAYAGQVQAQKDAAEADKAYKQAQEDLRKDAQSNLDKARRELATTGDQLKAERAARAEAERKLALALKSLEEIAKVREEQRGLVITLEGAVLFVSGKSELLPIAQDKLGKVAEVLQQQPDEKRIVVEGHTDSVGSDSDNLRLSQSRAESVRTFMVNHGVKPDRISAVGKGESTPVADNKTPEGRANNRRVEIIVK